MDCPRCGRFCSILDEYCDCGFDLKAAAVAKRKQHEPDEPEPVEEEYEPEPVEEEYEPEPVEEEYAPTTFYGPAVGDVLSLTARTIASSFIPLMAIAAFCLGPAIILDLILFVTTGKTTRAPGFSESVGARGPMWTYVGAIGVFVLQVVLRYVAQGAVMFLTIEYLAGRRGEIRSALSKATSRAVVVIATAIVESLLIGLGAMACLIPGIILACAYYVAVPVAVTENVGPTRALRRSMQMTRGYRGKVFLLFLVVFGLAIVMTAVSTAVRIPLSSSTNMGMHLAYWGVGWGFELVTAVVFDVMAAVTYALLRGVHDGIDAESLASVFA